MSESPTAYAVAYIGVFSKSTEYYPFIREEEKKKGISNLYP